MLRNEIEATVYRLPGQTFQSTQTHIKNVYTIKLINKTTESFDDIEIKLLSHSGEVLIVGGQLLLDKQDLKEGTLFIEIAKKDLNSSKEKIKLGIYSGGEIIETTTTNFMGPVKFD
jgi:hypothetical protein